MSVNTMQVPRGLDGVVVDETAICLPEKGVDRLYYRYDIAERVETVLMRERGMFANLDYYTALIYDACGLPMELFPPMFFLARIPGLIAHIGEQRSNNRLIHPSSKYIGRAARPVPNAGQLASASHTAETS